MFFPFWCRLTAEPLLRCHLAACHGPQLCSPVLQRGISLAPRSDSLQQTTHRSNQPRDQVASQQQDSSQQHHSLSADRDGARTTAPDRVASNSSAGADIVANEPAVPARESSARGALREESGERLAFRRVDEAAGLLEPVDLERDLEHVLAVSAAPWDAAQPALGFF